MQNKNNCRTRKEFRKALHAYNYHLQKFENIANAVQYDYENSTHRRFSICFVLSTKRITNLSTTDYQQDCGFFEVHVEIFT